VPAHSWEHLDLAAFASVANGSGVVAGLDVGYSHQEPRLVNAEQRAGGQEE